MITEKEKAIAEEFLADKLIKGVWVNTSGELFLSEHLAKASDEEAEFIRKPQEKKEQDTGAQDTNTQSTDAQRAELKEKNLKLLAETELKKENYNAMAALVKFFDIKTEDRKAETFISALTEFKETLNNL